MYGKDNILTIHTSDGDTLYFSKISLIHHSPVVKMLSERQKLNEINLPFDTKTVDQFFLYLETKQFIKDLYSFSLIADYLALPFDENYWIKTYLDSNHSDKLIYYLKYLSINQITFDENIMSAVKPITEKCYLNIEPIIHRKFRDLKLDWLDLAQVLLINNTYPEFIKEYNRIWNQHDELWALEQEILTECNGNNTLHERLIEFFDQRSKFDKLYCFQ